MSKSKKRYSIYSQGGVTFTLRYDFPTARAKTAEPCRGRVNLHLSPRGPAITKNQLGRSASSEPLDAVLYGKDAGDIYQNKLPALAASLLAELRLAGFLPSAPVVQHDLYALLAACKQAMFTEYYAHVKPSTLAAYQAQYDLMAADCRGIIAEALDQPAYASLQLRICQRAAANARNTGWAPGTEAPASAKKRLNLLISALQYLTENGVAIPAKPTEYLGRKPRSQEILDLTDGVRSLPAAELFPLLPALSETMMPGDLLLRLYAETDHRISEFCGLLWGSIQRLNGSQGYQYYLVITGQLTPDGKRIEYLKTDASYRYLPLSVALGEALYQRKQAVCSRYKNAENALLFAVPAPDGTSLVSTPDTNRAAHTALVRSIQQVFSAEALSAALRRQCAYRFDPAAQEEHLRQCLTPHAFRRNYCTYLYCRSGVTEQEIFCQMGHDDAHLHGKTARPRGGKTNGELYRMCLQKQVSPIGPARPQPLRYTAGKEVRATEVPACGVEWTIPPGASVELTLRTTEPGTAITLEGSGLTVSVTRRDTRRTPLFAPEALVADESKWTILSAGPLFSCMNP